MKIKPKNHTDYPEVLKEINLKKFRKKKIDVCPECGKIVRMKDDHYHAETICEQCGCVVAENITFDEIPEICVTDREMEIELNNYRRKKSDPDYKNRIGGLTRYPQLMMKYDRKTEGNMKKWRNKAYKDYVGVVNTNFGMTKTQQRRVLEIIDDTDDIKSLHGQASYEAIITALCFISMKKDHRRIEFNNKCLNKSQLDFIDEIKLDWKKYVRIMENMSIPSLSKRVLNKRNGAFKR